MCQTIRGLLALVTVAALVSPPLASRAAAAAAAAAAGTTTEATAPAQSNSQSKGSGGGAIVATFSGDLLQHLVVEKHSGLVYVGDVNVLYQLSPDLEPQVTVKTGPKLDSVDCPAVDCHPLVNKRMTDNVNKALVIDYTDTRLIACGSLFQGHPTHLKNQKKNHSIAFKLNIS